MINLVARLRLQDDMSSRFRRITRTMGDVEKRTRSVTRGVQRMGSAMLGSGRAISAQVSGMGGLKSGLLGVAGAYLSARGAVAAFNNTVGEAAKFEASSVAIEAIFNDKKLSDSYMKMVDKMAIDSPLLNSSDMLSNSKGLVAMTKNMDDLGKSWGIVEKLQVLDPTQGTDGATFALKEMFQGDALSMVERFGLNKKELNRIKKLSIPKQISEINSLLDGMGVTEEAINKMGQTTLGYWAQIGERADKFKRILGESSNSKIGEVLGNIVDKLDSLDLDAIAGKIDAGIGGAVQKIFEFSKMLWGIRAPVIAVAKAVGTFIAVVTGIIVVVKTIGLVAAAFSFLMSPVALLAFAIIGIGMAFKAAYKYLEPFRTAIDGIGDAFQAVTKIFAGEHKAAIDILKAAGFSEGQVSVIRKFGYGLKDAFDKLKGIFNAIPKIFNKEHKASIDILAAAGFSNEHSALIRNFGSGLSDAFDGIKSVFTGLATAFTGDEVGFQQAMQSAGFDQIQIDNIQTFANGLRGAFDRVKEVFSGLGTMLTGGGTTDLLSGLGFSPEAIGHITGFVENVKTHVGELVTFLGAKWTELQPGIATLMSSFVVAKDTIGEVFTTLLSILSPIFDALAVAFKIVADVAVMVFHNIIAPAVGFVISMFQAMWGAVGPILSLLGAAIGVAFGILQVVWDTILKPIAAWLMGAFAKSFEAAKPHVEAIGSAFSTFGGFVSGVTDKLKTFSSFLKNIKIPDWVSDIGGKIAGAASWVSNAVSGGSGKSNYHGNDRIPYDGYLARLHRGERILTRKEADEMDHISYEGVTGGATYNNQTYNDVSTTQVSGEKGGTGGGSVAIHIQEMNVRQESDIDDIAEALYVKINAEAEGGA